MIPCEPEESTRLADVVVGKLRRVTGGGRYVAAIDGLRFFAIVSVVL